MPAAPFKVARIAAYTDPPAGGGAAVLKLDDGTTYRLDPAGPKFAYWSTVIREVRNRNSLLGVAPDPAAAGAVGDLYWPAVRVVGSVAVAPDGDRLRVIFLMSPSPYFLRTTNPNFAATRALLERAAAGKAELLVSSDGDTLEIVDVRPVPPKAP